MRILFVTIVLIYTSSQILSAQSYSITYYDYKWDTCDAKHARFYSEVYKTDSGYVRTDYFLNKNGHLQMNGLFADTGVLVENGYFSYYYANRLLEEQGRYVLGKKDGLWVSYYPDGMMRDSVYYANGQKIKSFSWYSNGYLRDSSSFDEYGTGIDVGWFNNGNPSYAGLYKGGQKNAKWKYFHKNGNLAALEMYDMGNIKEVSYFDEAGNPQTVKYSPIDTLIRPFFAGSRDGKKWVNYLYSHVYFPPHYQIKNSDKVTILVSFTVTEEGGVSDVDIIVPFAPSSTK